MKILLRIRSLSSTSCTANAKEPAKQGQQTSCKFRKHWVIASAGKFSFTQSPLIQNMILPTCSRLTPKSTEPSRAGLSSREMPRTSPPYAISLDYLNSALTCDENLD